MPDKYQFTLFALLGTCLFSIYLLIRNKHWANLAQKNQRHLNAFQETKNQAISTISHEIRTPISAILGIQEKLLRNNHLDISKKTILLQEGEICNFEAFIVKGCIKTYYIDKNGLFY